MAIKKTVRKSAKKEKLILKKERLEKKKLVKEKKKEKLAKKKERIAKRKEKKLLLAEKKALKRDKKLSLIAKKIEKSEKKNTTVKIEKKVPVEQVKKTVKLIDTVSTNVETPVVNVNVPLSVSAKKDEVKAGIVKGDSSKEEAVKWRKFYGMDASGYPIKAVVTDPETGLVVRGKHGRKPKSVEPTVEVAISKEMVKETVKPFKQGKAVKTEKPAKKKEKSGTKGKVASAPILKFTEKELTLDTKVKVFDTAMVDCFGDKYDTKKLMVDGLSIIVTKTLTKPTAKNPNGVLLVQLSTKDKVAKFYEWEKKFWMAQLVNYNHYMKPIKK